MANSVHTEVMDSGLSVLTNATSTVFHLCSAQPTTRAEAISLSVANKTSPTIGSPVDASPNGRKVVMSAITSASPGTVTANPSGTDNYFAIIDATRLLVTGPISSAQLMYYGNTFTMPSALDLFRIAQPT